jgi:hypothetical protein
MTFEPNLTQRLVAKAKQRVIPNWKSRLGDYSTWALGVGAVVSGAVMAMPEAWQAHLPMSEIIKGLFAVNVAGGIGKFMVQGHVPAKD